MEIKLNLAPEQFRSLLDLVYLGNWMINSIRMERTEEHEQIMQMFFSAARSNGYEDLIEYDPEEGDYHANLRMHDSVEPFITAYEEDVYWNELVETLAERDLYDLLGDEAADNLDLTELLEQRSPFEEIYRKEFERNGIDHLYLREQA